jgi:V-type H+-transporting ATPase 16kDa proteolipid subunit
LSSFVYDAVLLYTHITSIVQTNTKLINSVRFSYCFISILNEIVNIFISTHIILICHKYDCKIDIGGAYGTAKAGQGLMAMGIRSPELLMKNIIPVVMAGVLGIYGLIVAVILNGKFSTPETGTGYATYSQYNGFSHLAAGLCVGLCSLASGLAIGIAADAGTRAVGAQSAMSASWKKMGFTGDAGGQVNSAGDALFVGIILIQVFASNLGLYGLIASLIMSQQSYHCDSTAN